MHLVAWALFCFLVVALFAQSAGRWLLCFAIAIRILLPSIAVPQVTGHSSLGANIHPATWLLIFLCGALMIRRRLEPGWGSSEAATLRIGGWLCGGAVTLFVVSALVTDQYSGRHYLPVLADVIGAPLLYGYATSTLVRADSRCANLLCRTLATLGVGEALLAFAQHYGHSFVVYDAAHTVQSATQNQYFGVFEGVAFSSRAVGTFDTPLDLGLFLVVTAGIALIIVRSMLGKCILIAAYLAAALATESRLAVLGLLAVVVANTVFRGRSRDAGGRLVTTAMILVLGAALLFSPLAAGFAARLGGADNGSLSYRVQAYHYFVSHIGSHIVYGGGFGSSAALRTFGVLRTSLEDGYAMFAYDIGLVWAGVLVVGLVVCILSALRDPVSRPYGYTALAAAAMCAGYSSIMDASAAGPILAVAVALAFTMRGRRGNEPARKVQAQTRRDSRPGVLVT